MLPIRFAGYTPRGRPPELFSRYLVEPLIWRINPALEPEAIMRWVICLFVIVAASTMTRGDPPSTRPATRPTTNPAAIKEKLIGRQWLGPACGGNYTFHADGTFDVDAYTPGQNKLAGTWSVYVDRDAGTPVLAMTATSSDFRKRDPNGQEYEYLGHPRLFFITRFVGNEMSWREPGRDFEWLLEVRPRKRK
jgi:hypothetical protein